MWRKRRKKGSLWQIRWWRIPSSSSSYCGSHSIECLEVWKAPFALKLDPISPEKWISGIKSRRLPPAKRPTTSNLTLVRRFPHRYHSSDRPKNKTKVCMLTFLHTRMTHWKFTSAVQYFLNQRFPLVFICFGNSTATTGWEVEQLAVYYVSVDNHWEVSGGTRPFHLSVLCPWSKQINTRGKRWSQTRKWSK